jgi:hypothetical protein
MPFASSLIELIAALLALAAAITTWLSRRR